ncbi:hypothetical protein ACA910_003750 [Epithemia clementina (nom. ined.)]
MSVTKETVVVWDGIMTSTPAVGSGGNFNVTWEGTVFVNLSAPDPSQVPEPVRRGAVYSCESDKSFSVTGTARPADGEGNGDLFKKYIIEFTGEWDLETGKPKVKDSKHNVLASLQWRGSPDKSDSLCFAQGRDEFGPFISTGYMKPGNRVTLARRYMDASDSRAKWTAEDVHKEIMKAIYDEEEEDVKVMPPWNCDVLKAC